MNNTTLPAITALARAGAVMRGWELFEAAGYAGRADDPAALAVKGRLLKGRARLARPEQSTALFTEAAAAYAAAQALDQAPYLAINAATLSLLAGDVAKAAAGARAVLALLDDPAAPPADTPYFLAATRAEALLILGESAGAQAAMEQAVRADPDGWPDRAATIAQLREIAAAQGMPQPWIERFAPPASLHFAGHMGFAAGGASETALAGQLDDLLASSRIGFAWGALAAGADLVIAERLLERGVELHAVLPCLPDDFAAQSVAPAGEAWLARYHAVLDAASSVRAAGSSPASVHDPLATGHAGELAIGGALGNAAQLCSTAAQLVVLDDASGGPNTARQAALWPTGAGLQHRLTQPRDAAAEALFPPEVSDPHRALTVHLSIDLPPEPGADSAAILARRAPLSAVLASIAPQRIRARPDGWDLALDDPVAALNLATALIEAARSGGESLPAIGAEIAIGLLMPDPPGGDLVPYGPGPARARALAAQAPAGLTLAGDALAVTLQARGINGRTQLYHPGDTGPDSAAHAVLERERDQ